MNLSNNFVLLKILAFVVWVMAFGEVNAQQRIFSIGPYSSSDCNFYKFSDGNFRDDERTNKIKLGFTIGFNAEVMFLKKLALDAGLHFSKKFYTPKRLFSFGVLSAVQFNTIEFPLNLKYYFSRNRNPKFIPFAMIGLVYQFEKNKQYTFTDVTGITWMPEDMHYIIPAVAFGLNYYINDHLSLQGDLNYRYSKCHCEYLNEYIDKVAVGVALKVKI